MVRATSCAASAPVAKTRERRNGAGYSREELLAEGNVKVWLKGMVRKRSGGRSKIIRSEIVI
jgi:hypothetical protein